MFRVVPLNINIRDLKFKERANIEIIANILSGIVGIYLAYHGFGVKSLIYQMLIASLVITLLHNHIAEIKYKLVFNFVHLKEIWSLSNKIFLNQMLSTIFNNLNSIVIGKFFPVAHLGYYNRAKSFSSMIQKSLVQSIQRSIFPVFSQIKHNNKIKELAEITIKNISYIGMPIIMFLAASSENIILILLSDKWVESIIFLRLLCFIIIFYIPQMVYLNTLKAIDQDLFFKSESISKILRLALLIVSIPFGVKGIIIGNVIQCASMTFISGEILNKKISNFNFIKRLNNFLSPFIYSIIVFIIFFYLETILSYNNALEFFISSILFSASLFVYLKNAKIIKTSLF